MTAIVAILSPIIIMVGIYLLERRMKRIRREQKTYAEPKNEPDFEDEITNGNGFQYSKKSSVDDRLIELDKRWNDPMG